MIAASGTGSLGTMASDSEAKNLDPLILAIWVSTMTTTSRSNVLISLIDGGVVVLAVVRIDIAVLVSKYCLPSLRRLIEVFSGAAQKKT